MQLTNKICAFTAIIAAFYGCSADPAGQPEKVLSPEVTALYSIDPLGQIASAHIFHQPHGSSNVYLIDPGKMNFGIVNVENGTLSNVATLQNPIDWENYSGFMVDEKAGEIRVFYVDSIITYDFDGRQLGKFDLNDVKSSGFIYPKDLDFLPVYRNGKMYVSYFEDIKNSYKTPEFFATPIEVEIDIKTKKARLLPQTYPSNYRQNCYSFSYTASRLEISPDEHAYSFPHNDSVFIRNLKTGELTTHYFGVRRKKKIEFIPYDKISSVHANAFTQLALKNPFYVMPKSLPLAGCYSRRFIIPGKTEESKPKEYVVFYDRKFNYLGEFAHVKGWLIDSKKGPLVMLYENDRITIKKLKW